MDFSGGGNRDDCGHVETKHTIPQAAGSGQGNETAADPEGPAAAWRQSRDRTSRYFSMTILRVSLKPGASMR